MTSNMPKKAWPFRVSPIFRSKSDEVNADALRRAAGLIPPVRAAVDPEAHREFLGNTETSSRQRTP
jgi:hypothetical protein